MKPFVLDIETGPRPDAADFLPHIDPPSNYKDPAKIEAYLAERRQKQLADAALSAETGRVLVVGLLRHGETPRFIDGDGDEAQLLQQFWLAIGARAAGEALVTFNGVRFDFPFMIRRSFAHGVPVPSWMPLDGRWPRHCHIDLLSLWQAGDRQESISLDRLARLCGLPGKTGNGADFAPLWAIDRKAALDYLHRDLELTAAIFTRITADACQGAEPPVPHGGQEVI